MDRQRQAFRASLAPCCRARPDRAASNSSRGRADCHSFGPCRDDRRLLPASVARSPSQVPGKRPMKKRCAWVNPSDPLMTEYHDREWGVEVHDDMKHFEFLILEGAQAGLSWATILKRREGYRRAFGNFDPKKVASYSEERIEELLL